MLQAGHRPRAAAKDGRGMRALSEVKARDGRSKRPRLQSTFCPPGTSAAAKDGGGEGWAGGREGPPARAKEGEGRARRPAARSEQQALGTGRQSRAEGCRK